MKYPVVTPDGTPSYERKAIVDWGGVLAESKLYPNRALRDFIEEQRMITSGLRLQKRFCQALQNVLVKPAIPSPRPHRPLPAAYYCPITAELMHVPVVDPEGNTYEKAAIEAWIRVNPKSPITRNALKSNDLHPNNAILELLEEEKRKPEDCMHPSIRKMKEARLPLFDNYPIKDSATLTQEENDEENRELQDCTYNLTLMGWCFVLAAFILMFFFFQIVFSIALIAYTGWGLHKGHSTRRR